MENIISDILKIEEEAQKRLTDAENESIKIISDAKAEKENIINAYIREADEKIKKYYQDEKYKTEQRLIVIEEEKIKEISHIDDVYNSKHNEWEEEIFNQIING